MNLLVYSDSKRLRVQLLHLWLRAAFGSPRIIFPNKNPHVQKVGATFFFEIHYAIYGGNLLERLSLGVAGCFST